MGIANVIVDTAKDAVAITKSISKVVTEEVKLFMEEKRVENEAADFDDEVVDSKSLFKYFDDFESKARELVNNAFSGFKSSKTEEQEELERRISALEERLSKLVEESLDALRNEEGRV